MDKAHHILSDIGKSLREKLREALVSVIPVTALVFLLSITPWVDITPKELGVFAISAVLLIVGIGLFNVGADLAMTPMGQHIGEGLTRSRKLGILLSVCFVMGVLITVAEPDLSVLAEQVVSEVLILVVWILLTSLEISSEICLAVDDAVDVLITAQCKAPIFVREFVLHLKKQFLDARRNWM